MLCVILSFTVWQAFAHGAKAVASDKTSGITKLSDDGCSIEEVPRPGSHATSYLPLLAPLLPPTATLAATARWLSPAAAQCTPRPPRGPGTHACDVPWRSFSSLLSPT